MSTLARRRSSKEGTNLYVVLLVTRTHHAVVNEIPTAAAPENAMAKRRKLRVSGGLASQISVQSSFHLINWSLQVTNKVCMAPVLNED